MEFAVQAAEVLGTLVLLGLVLFVVVLWNTDFSK